MKVLIVGAGIAGLALSAHLKQLGLDPVVVDNAPEWKPLGYVIGLWENGLRTLESFDVHKSLAFHSYYPPFFEIRNRKGTLLKQLSSYLVTDDRPSALLIKRSDFHEFLRSINTGTDIRLGTSVTSYESGSDGIEVTFTNGSVEHFDVLVGADGIDSQVRQLAFGIVVPIRTGVVSWLHMASGVIDAPKNVVEIWHKDSFFGVYPHTGDEIHTIFALKDETITENNWSIELLKQHFSEFGWIVPSVLKGIAQKEDLYCSEWREVVTAPWQKDRVVLIGDAAHAMLPTFGMGANVALEDALVLAQEIGRTDEDLIHIALETYENRRREKVERIRQKAEQIGSFLKAQSPFDRIIRDGLLHFLPTTFIEQDLRKLLSEQL